MVGQHLSMADSSTGPCVYGQAYKQMNVQDPTFLRKFPFHSGKYKCLEIPTYLVRRESFML
jgi:hypothetical protein